MENVEMKLCRSYKYALSFRQMEGAMQVETLTTSALGFQHSMMDHTAGTLAEITILVQRPGNALIHMLMMVEINVVDI